MRALFELGLLYDLGEGVGQDAAAAYNWHRRAAEAVFLPAQSALETPMMKKRLLAQPTVHLGLISILNRPSV
jgi:TPR repeat protein